MDSVEVVIRWPQRRYRSKVRQPQAGREGMLKNARRPLRAAQGFGLRTQAGRKGSVAQSYNPQAAVPDSGPGLQSILAELAQGQDAESHQATHEKGEHRAV